MPPLLFSFSSMLASWRRMERNLPNRRLFLFLFCLLAGTQRRHLKTRRSLLQNRFVILQSPRREFWSRPIKPPCTVYVNRMACYRHKGEKNWVIIDSCDCLGFLFDFLCTLPVLYCCCFMNHLSSSSYRPTGLHYMCGQRGTDCAILADSFRKHIYYV